MTSLQMTHHHRDVEYPPCFFNPLCTCSKAVPDLGIVTCRDVPLPRIPPPINSSKVFMLSLENNGMGYLEPHFLEGTGQFFKSFSFWMFHHTFVIKKMALRYRISFFNVCFYFIIKLWMTSIKTTGWTCHSFSSFRTILQ